MQSHDPPKCLSNSALDLGSELVINAFYSGHFSKLDKVWSELDQLCGCMVDRIGGFIQDHGEVVLENRQNDFATFWWQLLESAHNNCGGDSIVGQKLGGV